MRDSDGKKGISLGRRNILRAVGGIGALGIAGCSGDGDGGTNTPGGGTETTGTATATGTSAPGSEYEPPAESEWPPRVEPSNGGIGPDPPGDATILYDGEEHTLNGWVHSGASPLGGEEGAPAEWHERDGYFETNPETGDIRPDEAMGDCHLHLEWRVPEDLTEPDKIGRAHV